MPSPCNKFRPTNIIKLPLPLPYSPTIDNCTPFSKTACLTKFPPLYSIKAPLSVNLSPIKNVLLVLKKRKEPKITP